MSFTSQNHYVPQWYQKRFYLKKSKENKVYYLDLTPGKINKENGGYYFRNDTRRLGTKECFKQKHLYTLFFKEYPTDVIEKRFFGTVDIYGARAVEFFSKYEFNDKTGEAYQGLIQFMSAQKLRTPKGLEFLKLISGRKKPEEVLALMQSFWQMHGTIWSEGVWEVVECNQSLTKFIVSDHPITTYNKSLFPGSASCRYPYDAEIERVGTHTIFPLDLNHCLIITNLGYVRNPKINTLKTRENPRYFEQTMFDMRYVQTGREIPEKDVLAINYVIKMRAKRYIASSKKEWLYPESHLSTTMWNKLGSKNFLMPDPRKVTFTTATFVGGDNGPILAQDEYGRIINDDDPKVLRERDKEWRAFQAFKKSWDTMYGKLSREELRKFI